MFEQRGHMLLIVGAVLVFAAQVVLVPYLAIGSAMPNLVAAYCVSYAVAAPRRVSPLIMAFVCGMLYNLVCGGVVGCLGLVLTLVVYLSMRVFETLDSENVPTGIVGVCAALLVTELLYALLTLFLASEGSLPDALLYRVAPCGIYDCVMGVLFYLVLLRFAGRESNQVNIDSVRLV